MKNYWSLNVSRTVNQEIMRVHKPKVEYKFALQERPKGALYSTANDPQPQMIPRPQMIPKMDRKWSSTASDPQRRPQMIPKEK